MIFVVFCAYLLLLLGIGLTILALSLFYWLATGHHVTNMAGESVLFVIALGNALSLGLLAWVLYMALEPYARRLWPEALVSWTRLLAGRFREFAEIEIRSELRSVTRANPAGSRPARRLAARRGAAAA